MLAEFVYRAKAAQLIARGADGFDGVGAKILDGAQPEADTFAVERFAVGREVAGFETGQVQGLFHDLVAVLVSLIPHRTAKMMFSKAGCPPINSATNLFLTETQGM